MPQADRLGTDGGTKGAPGKPNGSFGSVPCEASRLWQPSQLVIVSVGSS